MWTLAGTLAIERRQSVFSSSSCSAGCLHSCLHSSHPRHPPLHLWRHCHRRCWSRWGVWPVILRGCGGREQMRCSGRAARCDDVREGCESHHLHHCEVNCRRGGYHRHLKWRRNSVEMKKEFIWTEKGIQLIYVGTWAYSNSFWKVTVIFNLQSTLFI